jgi:FkbM family methyltransferase
LLSQGHGSELKTIIKNGHQFLIDNNSCPEAERWTSWWDALEQGVWEPETFAIMDRLLSSSMTYLDVGAWIGPTVLYASQLCERCYALEPDPIAYKQLCANIAANKIQNVVTFNEAILNYNGVVAIGNEQEFGNSITRINQPIHAIQVPCLTLESFVARQGITTPLFVKMDVEGAEELILECMEFFEKLKPILYVSLHPQFVKDADRALETVRKIGRLYKHRYDVNLNAAEIDEFRGAFVFTDSGQKFDEHRFPHGEFEAVDHGTPALMSAQDDDTAKRVFSSLASCLQSEIPILVPCFNNPTYLRNMVRQLSALKFENIIVVDNASTYPPMEELLSQLSGEVTIVALAENKGARNVFLDDKNYALLPQYFCVTDPDLEFSPHLPSDFLAELVRLTEKHAVGKAGFSVGIDQASMWQDEYLIGGKKYKMWEWEEQFRQQPLERIDGGEQVYRAPIDTTFAVYNKKYFKSENPLEAVRVAGRYTCQRLPTYKKSIVPESEKAFYRQTSECGHYDKQSAEYATALLLTLYRRRPDLQGAFPEVAEGERSRLIEWAVGVSTRAWEDGDYETLLQYAKWYSMINEQTKSTQVATEPTDAEMHPYRSDSFPPRS